MPKRKTHIGLNPLDWIKDTSVITENQAEKNTVIVDSQTVENSMNEDSKSKTMLAYSNSTKHYLVVLSAKTDEALSQKMIDLLEWLNGEGKEKSLLDISYSLLVGRSHFSIRSCFVVESIAQLIENLQSVIETGNSEKYQSVSHISSCDFVEKEVLDNGNQLLTELSVCNGQEDKSKDKVLIVAELYLKGYKLDWKRLFKMEKPHRISMPTYPFAKESYWVDEEAIIRKTVEKASVVAGLHPLIDRNSSTFDEQSYKKTLSGEEFFLKHHVVGEEMVLPGVAYLEMAWNAAKLSFPNEKVQKLQNIIWANPISLKKNDTEKEIFISMYEMDGDLEYEVYSILNESQRIIHGQGSIVLENETESFPIGKSILLTDIEKRLNQNISGTECYERFDQLGLHLGESFHTIQNIRCNHEEVVAHIKLPSSRQSDFERYQLHPSMIDGALETVVALVDRLGSNYEKLSLPYALSSIEQYGVVPDNCYSYARLVQEDESTRKFDVDIVDEDGNIIVQMKGFALKVLSLSNQNEMESKVFYYTNEWKQKELFDAKPSKDVKVFLFGAYDNWIKQESVELLGSYQSGRLIKLSTETANTVCIAKILNNREESGDALKDGLYELFTMVREVKNSNYNGKTMILLLYETGHEEIHPLYAGLDAFAKTVAIEIPSIQVKIVEVESTKNVNEVLHVIFNECSGDKLEVMIRYSGHTRYVQKLTKIGMDSGEKNPITIRDNGVYLITGGMGGLGKIFAQFIAKSAKANIILTGRKDANTQSKNFIRELEAMGVKAIYVKCDVAKKQDVEELKETIKKTFGNITGILHCAGITRDHLILDKSEREIAEVIAPKVYGTIYIDEVFKDERLEFFSLFSSIAAMFGNQGQCDYAFANSFMNYFAERRNQFVTKQIRYGKTASINWSFWNNGGMQIDKASSSLYAKATGLESLDTNVGLAAFLAAWKLENSYYLVVTGDRTKLEKTFGLQQLKRVNSQSNFDRKELENKVHKDLATIIERILRVRQRDIVPNKDLSEYGFNSLTYTDFSTEINNIYGTAVTPAIFFEHPTLHSFEQYLISEYQDLFEVRFSSDVMFKNEEVCEKNRIEQTSDQTIRSRRTKKVVNISGEVDFATSRKCEPVAIVGIAGMMPGSENLDEFWDNLITEKDLISEIPEERWDWRTLKKDEKTGRSISKWGGFMKEVDKFDAKYFGISPREAELMDPQQRLFMQIVWKAIEDSGHPVSSLAGTKTGLFVGVSTMDYSELLRDNGIEVEAYSSTGISHCILANRISYLLDIHGPSEPVDTACSSSLVAIHRGVEGIRNGEMDMAIAGGVNVMLRPTLHISFSKSGMLAEDGRCKTFSQSANGYVRGEGVGAVLMKPLSKALEDGDYIYALIKGTAINHGGHTNSLTTPNPNAQAELLEEAYEKSGILPEHISYIEAHGTGTNLGDPIEINGLKLAFKNMYRKENQVIPQIPYCAVSSVKTNIGHLEAAAGIAGILKVVLSLQHKQIPGNIHLDTVNPYIDIENSPFTLVKKSQEWKPIQCQNGEQLPRIAGVSSFGFGGVNAHIVLEEFTNEKSASHEGRPEIIVLSAKDKERLIAYAKEVIAFIEKKCITPNKIVVTSNIEDKIQGKLTEEMINLIAEATNIHKDEISVKENLYEFINDPFVLSILLERINSLYQLDLVEQDLLDNGSIEELVQFLIKNYGESLSKQHALETEECMENIHEETIVFQDFAYTLQVGRDAMEERIAFVASDFKEAHKKLSDYITNDESIEQFYHGNIKNTSFDTDLLLDGEEGEEFIHRIIVSQKLTKLCQLWVSGVGIDWKLMYGINKDKPHRIPAPTYPFERKCYWFTNTVETSRIKTLQDEVTPLSKALNQIDEPEEKLSIDEVDINSIEIGNEVTLDIVDGSIAVIKMQDDANRNMFSDKLILGLVSCFKEIHRREEIKAVIVTGSSHVFSMGGTQEQLMSISEKKSKFTDVPFLYKGLLECDVPVISAMQGHASGGGMLFGLYADIVVMSKESVYSASFTKYGFTPGMGATFILKDKLGKNIANEMMFTARNFTGEELENRGASVIFRKREDVLNEAMAIARMMSKKPRKTLMILKKQLVKNTLRQLPEVLNAEAYMHDLTFSDQEVQQRIERYYIHNEEPSLPKKKVLLGQSNSNELTQTANKKISLKNMNVERTLDCKKPADKKELVRDELENVAIQNLDQMKVPVLHETIKQSMKKIISEILHLSEGEISNNASFRDLGVDSINGVEIIRDLNSKFGLNMEAVELYDYATIDSLSAYMYEEIEKGKITFSSNIQEEVLEQVENRQPKLERLEKEQQEKEQQEKEHKETEKNIEEIYTTELIQKKLIQITSEILHMNPGEIELESSFRDLGIDSINGVEIVRDINSTYGINIEAIALYDYATIKELCKYISEEIKQRSGGLSWNKEEIADTDLELLRKLQSGELDVHDVDQLI